MPILFNTFTLFYFVYCSFNLSVLFHRCYCLPIFINTYWNYLFDLTLQRLMLFHWCYSLAIHFNTYWSYFIYLTLLNIVLLHRSLCLAILFNTNRWSSFIISIIKRVMLVNWSCCITFLLNSILCFLYFNFWCVLLAFYYFLFRLD